MLVVPWPLVMRPAVIRTEYRAWIVPPGANGTIKRIGRVG